MAGDFKSTANLAARGLPTANLTPGQWRQRQEQAVLLRQQQEMLEQQRRMEQQTLAVLAATRSQAAAAASAAHAASAAALHAHTSRLVSANMQLRLEGLLDELCDITNDS